MQVFRYTFVCFLLKSVKVGLVLGVKCVLLVYNKTCGRWKSVHLNNMPDSGGRRLVNANAGNEEENHPANEVNANAGNEEENHPADIIPENAGNNNNAPGQLDEAAIVTLSTGPHELLEAKEDAEWLERRISQLPTTQHTLLYMRQVERRSHKELSALLGISEASVSTLLARARRTLLEEIKQRNRQ